MRLKTDENVHPEAAEYLRAGGHDTLTVWDQELRGAADEDIGQICRREQRALVTFDTDFADIRAYPPEEFAGLLVLRLGSQSRSHVLRVLQWLMPMLDREPLVGRLWIVDEQEVRIRGGAEP